MQCPQPKSCDISVVVPAFNEAQRLAASLEKIVEYLTGRRLAYEVLVVDDGSTDRTREIAETFAERGVRALRLPENRGKGAAVKVGVLASRGQLVLISDADLSTPIEELMKLEAHLGEAELVIGSRAVTESRITVRQPLYRELMGRTFNFLIRLLAVRGFSDTQCGFKLALGEVARELFTEIETPGFAFDVELIWLAQRRGHRIAEVGVLWENSADSRVNALTAPPRMILEIFRFRWVHRSRARRGAGSRGVTGDRIGS